MIGAAGRSHVVRPRPGRGRGSGPRRPRSRRRGRRRARRSSRGGSRHQCLAPHPAGRRNGRRASSGRLTQVAQVGPGVDVAALVADRRAPRPGRSGGEQRGAAPCRAAPRGRGVRRRAGRASRTPAELAATVGVDEERRRRGPAAASRRRRKSPASTRGMSTASTPTSARAAAAARRRPVSSAGDRAAVRRVLAGEGHRPGGRHRGRRPRRPRRRRASASSACSSRVRPRSSTDGLVGPVQPGGRAAGEDHAAEADRGEVESMSAVLAAVVAVWRVTRAAAGRASQQGVRPRPGRQPRAASTERRARATPTWSSSPRPSPATSARPAPTSARTPSRSTGRSRPRSPGSPTRPRRHRGRRDVRGRRRTPTRPFNTLVVARRRPSAAYRKIHLYDSFGYRESDRLTGRPAGAGRRRRRGLRGSG